MADVIPTWSQQTANDGAKVELIALAINDAFQYSPEVYAAYLRSAISIARAVDKIVILQTPNPTYETRVALLAQTMRDVGLEMHTDVIDVEAFMHDLYGTDLSFAGDKMHPSQSAYAQIGGFVNRRLREIFLGPQYRSD